LGLACSGDLPVTNMGGNRKVVSWCKLSGVRYRVSGMILGLEALDLRHSDT
jgi:hypothetical protein